jgi:hypothetical protein
MTSQACSRPGSEGKHASPHLALAAKLNFVHGANRIAIGAQFAGVALLCKRRIAIASSLRKLNPPANVRIEGEAHCRALDR